MCDVAAILEAIEKIIQGLRSRLFFLPDKMGVSMLGGLIHFGLKQVCKWTVTNHDTIPYSYIFQSRGNISRVYKKLMPEALEKFIGRLLHDQLMHECAMLIIGPSL